MARQATEVGSYQLVKITDSQFVLVGLDVEEPPTGLFDALPPGNWGIRYVTSDGSLCIIATLP